MILEWPQIFDSAVERLLNSPNPDERESLFMGMSLPGEHPVLAPRKTLLQNGHILGDPGSNKTSKGFAPLQSQLIASGNCTVINIDLKGDMAQFQNVRIEAERAGLPLKVFTNRPGWESNVFNPLNQSYLARRNRGQRAEQMIPALGLDYGDIYGGAYFSGTMEQHLRNILYAYGDSITSLTDLYRFCGDPAAYKKIGPASDWENSRHLHLVLGRLAAMHELNASPQNSPQNSGALEGQIQLEELVTKPTVLHVFIQSLLSPAAARSIPRLLLYGLLEAKALLLHERPTVDVFVFIDEAQQIVSASLPMILAMCRSHGIGVILAHQVLDQLKLGELDLTQIMLSTTAYKQIFRASDLVSRDYLMRSGGESRYHEFNWSQAVPYRRGMPDERYISARNAPPELLGFDPVVGISEKVGPTLDPNTIMRVSADPDLSLFNVTEDYGFSNYHGRWTTIMSGYHITGKEYERRMTLPWPKGDPSRIVVPLEWEHARRVTSQHRPQLKTDPLADRVKKSLRERRLF
jgi:hypothetical protein